jgi:hypothetical protein
MKLVDLLRIIEKQREAEQGKRMKKNPGASRFQSGIGSFPAERKKIPKDFLPCILLARKFVRISQEDVPSSFFQSREPQFMRLPRLLC